jgi:hypothetical protein
MTFANGEDADTAYDAAVEYLGFERCRGGFLRSHDDVVDDFYEVMRKRGSLRITRTRVTELAFAVRAVSAAYLEHFFNPNPAPCRCTKMAEAIVECSGVSRNKVVITRTPMPIWPIVAFLLFLATLGGLLLFLLVYGLPPLTPGGQGPP